MRKKNYSKKILSSSPIGVAEFTVGYRTRLEQDIIIHDSHSTVELLRKIFNPETMEYKESFYMLMLNRTNRVIGYHLVSEGGTAGTVVDPKIIFTTALLSGASNLILAHNHPSGSVKPSEADVKLTRNLVEAGRNMEIRILDHIIITKEGFGYTSFSDEGMI